LSFNNLWMNNTYSNYNNNSSSSWLTDGDYSNLFKGGSGFKNVNINIFGDRFGEPSVGSSLGFFAGGLSSMLIGGLLGGLFFGGNKQGQQVQQTPQNTGFNLQDYFATRFSAVDPSTAIADTKATTETKETKKTTETKSVDNNSDVNSKGSGKVAGDIPIDGDLTSLTMEKNTDKFPKSFTIKDKMKDNNGGQDEFTFHFLSIDKTSGDATYIIDATKDIQNKNTNYATNKNQKTYQFTLKAGAFTKGTDGKYKIDMNAVANQVAIMNDKNSKTASQ